MVATDDYGTDVLLTDAGDLSVTPAGQLALLSGPLNCAQALSMRLRTAPGELPLQQEYGNALPAQIIGTKSHDPSLVVSKVNIELRQIIQDDGRFLKAERIATVTDPADPTRTAVYVEVVLAAGDRLSVDDVTDTPPLTAFDANPGLADELDPDELAELLGEDPAELEDDVPELADFDDFDLTDQTLTGPVDDG